MIPPKPGKAVQPIEGPPGEPQQAQPKVEIPEDWRKAEKILQHVISHREPSAEAYVLSGILSFQKANWVQRNNYPPNLKDEYYRRAEDAFHRALKIDPDNKDAYWGLLLSNSRPQVLFHPLDRPKQDLDRTIGIFLKVLQFDPENEIALDNLGITYYYLRRFDEAEKVLEKLASLPQKKKHDPVRIEATEFLGRTYTALGKYGMAEKVLNDSIGRLQTIINDGADSYYKGCPYQAMGELYQVVGRMEESSLYFRKASEFDKQGIYDLLLHAVYCFEQGENQKALQQIEAIFLNPEDNSPMYKSSLAGATVLKGYLLIFQKRYDEAASAFLHAEQMNQADWGVHVGRGHLELTKRNYKDAAKHFKSSIKWLEKMMDKQGNEKPPNFDYQVMTFHMALLGMGWVSANQNRHRRAIKFYDQILQTKPNHLLALQSKGVSCTALHDLDQADKMFRKVLSLQASNEYALAELGIVEFNRGELEKAEELFNAALKEGLEEYTCPYEGLGLVYMRRGDLKKAKVNFEKAIRINPDVEYKKFNGLARIYIDEGRYAEAEELLRKSIKNHPYDNEAKKLLKEIDRRRSH